jgi:hypothetical protein
MKKNILSITLSVLFTLFAFNAFSQGPPPPPSGAGHGANGNQTGGNAPIGSGLFVLLGLGAAYGSRKLYNMKKEDLEE